MNDVLKGGETIKVIFNERFLTQIEINFKSDQLL